MSGIKVLLGFDMETDVGSFTPFYEGFAPGTRAILQVLAANQATGTFYFTGDAARKNPQPLAEVKRSRHEIGCHTLFHETIGEPIFEIAGMNPVLPHEVPERLRLATEWVAEASGERPVSFRAPRLFGSTAMVNALEGLGYLTDATYPLYFFREQLAPYHPSREDWTKAGNLKILEIPNFADLSVDSRDPYGRDRDQWPKFRTEGAGAVLQNIDGYCRYCAERGAEPFLCFYFHPWEFAPMPQGEIRFGEGYVRPDPFIVKNCGDFATEQLDLLLKALAARGAEFTQARQLAAQA